jgi:branched-chain amino acid aminotransferase
MSTTVTEPNTAKGGARAGKTLVWLDGQWLDRATAAVSVFDHGLLYGDGVFEGIRIYGGKSFKLEEHIDRLYDSAKAIWLDVPMPREEMIALTHEAVKRSGIQEGYIRHIVTRGVGDLGLNPKKCPRATVIIIVDTIALWPDSVYQTGLRVMTAGTPIPHREALSPRVKSLNYLPHIMAKSEGLVAGMDDVLMLDSAGHVAEASGCNVFVVKGRSIRTPPAYAGILRGVTRDVIIEVARGAGYEVSEELINRYDVYTADEVFFTGTAAEVVGIREVDGRTIGAGKPGPVTHDIAARYRALTRG